MAIPERAPQCGNPLPGPQIVSKDREARAASRPSLPDEPPRWPAVVMVITGVLSFVAGVLVVVGWHMGYIVSSDAFLSQSVPVRYNAGLCFVFGGTALLLLAQGRIRWGRVLAAPVPVIGLLTFCEYLFNVSLGIDRLFFNTSRVAPSIDARMAPNTAVCFTLLGGALLLTSNGNGGRRNSLQAFAAALLAALGLVGFIGYLAHIPTAYGWGQFTPMAAPTAAMMVALGLGTIALAWHHYTAGSGALPPWASVSLSFIAAAASVALWQALHALYPEQLLDTLALTMGLAQAALLYLVLHLLSSSRERALQLRQLNSALQDQMASVESAEREVRENQAYTRSLIEASLDPLVTITPDGKITDVNAATEAATGCRRQELMGTDFCDYFTEPAKARTGYQQAFREGGVRDYALELRHRDGRFTPVLYNASVYHDQAGNVIGVFAAARDISERKTTEEALRRSEQRYRALLIATAQVVWTTPPDGVVEDMPMWREYTGQSIEEVRGWGWLNAIHPEDRERTEAIWSKAVKTHGLYETEYRIRRADGQYRHFAIRGVPVLEQDGRIREWVGICTDIHERKQIEDELRKQAVLLNLAHDAIMVSDLQYRVTFWNRGAEETYGWSAKEASGREAPELLHTEFSVPLPEIRAAVQQQGEWEGELKHRTRDGRTIVVASRWSLQRDHHGAPASILEINRDITERKHLEQELQAGQSYTRSLIEASLDPLVTISADGKITDVNRATEAVTGFSRTELVGSDFSTYFTDPGKARAGYQQVFAEGMVQDYPLAIRHRSGRVSDVLYNASVFRNEAGKVEGVFAAARDVTERKRLDQELRARQAYTRSLIEASLDPLVTIAADGKITDVNAATEAVTGCSRQELIGSDFSNYFTEPDKARAGYQQVFAEGLVEDYPLAIRHRSGRVTEVLYNASVFRNEAGDVAGVFAAARDITERKRAEEELRLNRERLQLAQKVGRSGTFDWDIRNNINTWSPEIEDLYGLPAGGFAGTFEAWEKLVFPADLEKARAAITESLKTGEFQGEWRIIRPSDGQMRWLAARAKVLFDREAQPSHMVGINIDITERKQLEDSLRQRSLELENSVAELEAFSYSVSHDLRAPLRSIDGFSQILLEDYRDKVDQDGQDSLRRIRNASQNMAQLIDALLQLSRVMRSELRREPVDLSVLALSTAAMIQKADPARRVRFRVVNGLQAIGDRRLLGVLLQNLLQNAWKFSARNPEPRVEFGITQTDGKSAYYVRDNGIGFDMTYVNKLFTPFQRLHAKEQFEGTGIGLATVQRVIKRHGGKVWAEGAVGKGATFYFSLE
jgi:PAS domain S-box-containing protein